MTDTGFTRTALALDGDERFVSLRRPLEASGLGMNLLILAPGQRGRIHDHEIQEEVYLVWEGTLTLMVEGEAHDLGRGGLARGVPGVRRQLANLGPERCASAAVVALIAMGATANSAAAPRQQKAMAKIRIAFSTWNGDAGRVIGVKSGIFKKAGLDVQYSVIEDPVARFNALKAGSLDAIA